MGIPLSRVQTDAPAWFPVEKFEEYIKTAKTNENTVFPELENSLKALMDIEDITIKREKIYGGLCTEIRATVVPTKGRTRPIISGVLPPGIKFSTSYLDSPFSLFMEYTHAFDKKLMDVSVTRPLAARADFARQHPFETLTFKFVNSDRKIFKNIYKTNQVSAFIRCGDRTKQVLISHVRRPEITGMVKNGMAYYEPTQYLKLSASVMKRSPNQSYTAEIATLLTEKAIIPYVKLDSNTLAKFWRFFDIRLRGGAILSPRAVPVSERFDPTHYMIGMGSSFLPMMSGVRNSFCPMSGGVATGSDAYAVASTRCNMDIFKKLRFYVFAQAGASVLQKSNYFIDGTPLCVSLASYGCGCKLSLGGTTAFEIDYSIPVYESPGIKCPNVHFCLAIE